VKDTGVCSSSAARPYTFFVPPPSNIPRPTIKRLSLYLRSLETDLAVGTATVSSRQLGQLIGITDAQVRKDLGNIGQLGQPGIGYRVEALRTELRRVLKTDREWNAVVVGVGNIGSAILHYPHFGSKGFRIVAALDASPHRIGQSIAALHVQAMSELPAIVVERDVRIGILAVPAEVAQNVAEEMIAAGIQGILNFAPIRIDVGGEAEVTSVDLSRSLEQLAYQVGIAD
jgi:redox-sensing transcriptional repressor